MTYDVIIFDSVGGPVSPRIAEERGVGGAEWTYLMLASALARSGRRVLVLSNHTRREVGDAVFGHVSFAYETGVVCDTLIVSRWSKPPPIEAKRIVWSLHDIPQPWMFEHVSRYAVVVPVSHWHAARVRQLRPDLDCRPIPPMLLDECYVRGEKDPNKFVYASAAMKGLAATLSIWEVLKKTYCELGAAKLYVCVPRDELSIDEAWAQRFDVCALGQLPARRVIAELRSAVGLFYVNSYTETNCMVAGAAIALGCRPHVMCRGDPGGLPETLREHPLLTAELDPFMDDFVRCYLDDAAATRMTPSLGDVPDRRMRALLPVWNEVLGC